MALVAILELYSSDIYLASIVVLQKLFKVHEMRKKTYIYNYLILKKYYKNQKSF